MALVNKIITASVKANLTKQAEELKVTGKKKIELSFRESILESM